MPIITGTCQLCAQHTVIGHGTKLCDPCWELDKRVRANPELALTVLWQLFQEWREQGRPG